MHHIPEVEDTGCSPDLVVGDNVTVFLAYIAHMVQDRVEALLGVRSFVKMEPQMRTWHGLIIMLFPVPGTTTGGFGALGPGRLELAVVEDDMSVLKRPLLVAA